MEITDLFLISFCTSKDTPIPFVAKKECLFDLVGEGSRGRGPYVIY